MWHSCVSLTIDDFFKGKNPRLRRLFKEFLNLARSLGPVTVNVTKGGINFQTRVRFAGIARVTKERLVCGFWLKRQIRSPRFTKIEFIPPNNYIYQFILGDAEDLDDQVASWITEAYNVGKQESLQKVRMKKL